MITPITTATTIITTFLPCLLHVLTSGFIAVGQQESIVGGVLITNEVYDEGVARRGDEPVPCLVTRLTQQLLCSFLRAVDLRTDRQIDR